MTRDTEAASPDTADSPLSPANTLYATNRPTRRTLAIVAGIAAGVAAGVVAGVAAGVVAATLGLRFGRSLSAGGLGRLQVESWQAWAVMAICLIAIPLVLLAHEVGHLLGGRLVGFRAFLLIVGPGRLERSDAGWSQCHNKELGL